VREEVLLRRGLRLVRARAEEDVGADSEGDGDHAPVERVGLGVGVDVTVVVRMLGGRTCRSMTQHDSILG